MKISDFSYPYEVDNSYINDIIRVIIDFFILYQKQLLNGY
jgi:hypothetical protein